MSKKIKRELKKNPRFWIPRKWRLPAIVALVLTILYFLFLLVSSLFNGGTTDTYIEVFVGDWMRGTNDSRTLPIVFDVLPTSPSMQEVILPNENIISLGHGIGAFKYLPHCGLPDPCASGEFGVHIYTGKDHNDHPMLCVDGKYVIGGGTIGGRGINVAVIDILTKSVVQIRNFDTYVQESTQLETLLLTLRPGDIIIMLTFDEPTKKLSRVARLLFHDLGSSMAQNLQYRAGWYLVTQKGITGFTPYEGLNLVDSDGWPAAHDQKFCVPINLVGEIVHPDSLPRLNPERNSFCRRHPIFPAFCDGDVINDGLQPAAALKSGMAGTEIFSTPFVVMSGTALTLKHLPVTLETIVRQPGINPKFVIVYYLPQHPEVAELAELFGFMSQELTCKGTPCVHALDAFQTTFLLFPDSESVVYVEENVVLSPDFVSFLGQLLPILKMDPTLDAISGYNVNGYVGVSGDSVLLHRARKCSAAAILIRKKAVGKQLCTNRTRQEWLVKGLEISGDVLVPDLSRAVYIPPLPPGGKTGNAGRRADLASAFTEAVLKRDRETSLLSEVRIPNVHLLVKDNYERILAKEIAKSQIFQIGDEEITKCVLAASLLLMRDAKSSSSSLLDPPPHSPPLPTDAKVKVTTSGISILAPDLVVANFTRQILSFHFEQESLDDFTRWRRVTSCLGLFSHPLLSPTNLYNGTIRFTWRSNKVYLVSSLSKFSPFQLNLRNDSKQSFNQSHQNNNVKVVEAGGDQPPPLPPTAAAPPARPT